MRARASAFVDGANPRFFKFKSKAHSTIHEEGDAILKLARMHFAFFKCDLRSEMYQFETRNTD